MAEGKASKSKLAERLAEVARGGAPRMGFGVGSGARPPAMLLLVRLTTPEPALAQAALSGGADGLIMRMEGGRPEGGAGQLESLEAILPLVKDKPCGLALESMEWPLEKLAAIGVDFLLLPVQKAEAALLRCNLGKVVSIDHTLRPEMLRGLERLPVDGALLEIAPPEAQGQRISIIDLLRYKQFADQVPKPIMVATQLRFEPEEVGFLREMGAEALVLEQWLLGNQASSVERGTRAFHRAIEALPPGRRRLGGVEAVLPTLAGPTVSTESEEW